MATGGFKTREQAAAAIIAGSVDIVGIARALVLDPELTTSWSTANPTDPDFPRFTSPPEGGITAWYTMRLTQIGEDRESSDIPDLAQAIRQYEQRDRNRVGLWADEFG